MKRTTSNQFHTKTSYNTIPGTLYGEEIVQDIIDKKELRGLSVDFVKNKLAEFLTYPSHVHEKQTFLKKMATAKSFSELTKSKEYVFVRKSLRAELRKIYGVFIKNGFETKERLLDQLTTCLDKRHADKNMLREEIRETHEKLLSLHQSTKERLDDYTKIYMQIFSHVPQKDSYVILDLACGLNPLSNIFIDQKIRVNIKKYVASDISSTDCAFIDAYFEKIFIPHETFAADLSKNLENIRTIHADVCFLFKALDSIERAKRGSSEALLDAIHASIIVVSFPSATISGAKSIATSKRSWFERLLQKKKFCYEIFYTKNELFYIITPHQKNGAERNHSAKMGV